jgi:8-oxo-dGTP pyrophosphatase MutT (NUDIX family)
MVNKILNIEIFTGVLRSALQKPLPAIEAQRRMIPEFPENPPDYFNYDLVLRDAAVLIMLFEENDTIKTVLIERMPDAGPHSGQIAFPGGRKEETDSDIIETAIRETEEEIGVKIDRNNFIGNLTPVQIPISGYSVTPVLCAIDFVPKFLMCKEEVKNIFVADLFDLLNSETIKYLTVREMEIKAPCYILQDKIVWGATAMVLSEFKAILSQI